MLMNKIDATGVTLTATGSFSGKKNNVWASIIGSQMIRPIFFDDNFTRKGIKSFVNTK